MTNAPYGPPSGYEFSWANYQAMGTIENNILSFVKYRDNPWNCLYNVVEVSHANHIETFHSIEDNRYDEELGRMFLDEKQYRSYVANMESAVAAIWKTYRTLRTMNIGSASSTELFEAYNAVQEGWQQVIGYFRHTQVFGTVALTDELKRYVPEENVDRLLRPVEMDIAELEIVDWEEFIKKPFADKDALEHACKYPWLVSVHFTYDDVLKTLRSKYDFDVRHQKKNTIRDHKELLGAEQKVILLKYPEVRPLAERLQRFALSRMEVKSAFAGEDFYLIPVVAEIARRTGESVRDIYLYYRIGEVQALLSDGARLAEGVKSERKKCFAAILRDGETFYYEGQAAEDIVRATLGLAYVVEDTNEFSGIVACKGVVRGIARILHANDVENSRKLRTDFKKGEILVTEMTQPNIMDIATKAGGIVTDEGGLLSHAAIISRELNIPCIVGSVVATKVIKDGDMVEVDAEKGIIRILKSNI